MEKTIRVTRWLSIALLFGSLVCWGAFRLIGAEVDAQGVLREPFFLIPLGGFLLTLGLISAVVHMIARFVSARRKKKGQ